MISDDVILVFTLTVKVLVRHGVDGPGSTLVAVYGPQVMVARLQASAIYVSTMLSGVLALLHDPLGRTHRLLPTRAVEVHVKVTWSPGQATRGQDTTTPSIWHFNIWEPTGEAIRQNEMSIIRILDICMYTSLA